MSATDTQTLDLTTVMDTCLKACNEQDDARRNELVASVWVVGFLGDLPAHGLIAADHIASAVPWNPRQWQPSPTKWSMFGHFVGLGG